MKFAFLLPFKSENILIMAMACVMCSCVHAHMTVDKGVSEDLAQMRRENVSDVRYHLEVCVPDTISERVSGCATLHFDWRGDCDLPIDYSGQPDSTMVTVRVNDNEPRRIMLLNEHVTIPASLLHKGENTVSLPFVSNDKTLNRHDDYLYTLFVPANARTAFPCFDQPDLKARFTLELVVPEGWKAAGNAPLDRRDGNRYVFKETQPLPTYLFSYIAGQFDRRTGVRGPRQYTAYYRDSNEKRDKQIDQAFDIIDYSIEWLEDYTGIEYPFEKYDFVVLPGYQFGGMEHPGIVQYKDSRIFLSDNPTLDEQNARFNLLAHETAHMWFGDMVTMRWFDDVWTKEVFANFMADKITAAKYPDVDFDLAFISNHYSAAYSVDRTPGTHAIQQPLDNLNNAGLMYDNIIYHKAPIMMHKMEAQMGEDGLRVALRAYLNKYMYSNATWDDLIALLDSVAPEAEIRQFDRAWVKEKGMPVIVTEWANDTLYVTQADREGRGLLWPQFLQVAAYQREEGKMRVLDVPMDQPVAAVQCPGRPDVIFPNFNGLGYGRFVLDTAFVLNDYGLAPSQRLGLAMTVYENHEMDLAGTDATLAMLRQMLDGEKDPHVASAICKYLLALAKSAQLHEQKDLDEAILCVAESHQMPMVRQMLLGGLVKIAQSEPVLERMYELWLDGNDPMLSAKDYMQAAWHLAVMLPDRRREILARQRQRLTSDDQIREFDYVARACDPDAETRRRLFESLILPANRINEPWAAATLALLTDKSRGEDAVSYIAPGLDALPYIQQTSDIFFLQSWIDALLLSQTSPEAQAQLRAWIDNNGDMRPSLLRKVLTALR